MARFRYRMQNILSVKEKLENQAKNDFAVAAAALNEEERKLSELKERKKGYEDQLRILYSDRLDLNEIKASEDAVEIMKLRISEQEINVTKAEQVVETARQKLTVAMQDRKTHEKLKEKQFEEFKAEEAQKESKEIDELVSFRHGEEK